MKFFFLLGNLKIRIQLRKKKTITFSRAFIHSLFDRGVWLSFNKRNELCQSKLPISEQSLSEKNHHDLTTYIGVFTLFSF